MRGHAYVCEQKTFCASFSVPLEVLIRGYMVNHPLYSSMSMYDNFDCGFQSLTGRILHEVTLKESIRYADGDHVEAWLNSLLCLDATTVQRITSGCPVPSTCDLYYVNRDTLFSYHKASEAFLQRLMSLYVASHYKVRWKNYLIITIWIFILDVIDTSFQSVSNWYFFLGDVCC